MASWYDVTVMRLGSVRVQADSVPDAMRIVDETAKLGDVAWQDDWPAVDANEVEIHE